MCYQTHDILKHNKIHNLILKNMGTSVGIITLVFIVTMWNANIQDAPGGVGGRQMSGDCTLS